jgi:hypothetical protein
MPLNYVYKKFLHDFVQEMRNHRNRGMPSWRGRSPREHHVYYYTISAEEKITNVLGVLSVFRPEAGEELKPLRLAPAF